MHEPLHDLLALTEIDANLLIAFNILTALALGLLVGYERSYHGRAAGMRTYGLVCMASAALTIASGHPQFWFSASNAPTALADPTRVIQGIVTGVGFIGAGVIMREGLNISGLTTAASIWASSAIGIMVGLGFHLAAIAFALSAMTTMMWGAKLEDLLPSRKGISIVLRFMADHEPHRGNLHQLLHDYGYHIAEGTLNITRQNNRVEWRFVAIATSHSKMADLNQLAQRLSQREGIEDFQLSHARN